MRTVEITSNNKRVHEITGLDESQIRALYPNDIINPKFPMGVSPHYWKLVGSDFVEMTDSEKRIVDLDHAKNGVDNGRKSRGPRTKPEKTVIPILLFGHTWFFMGAGLSTASCALIVFVHFGRLW